MGVIPTIDWSALEAELGGGMSGAPGGTITAQRALEQLIGYENLENAVDSVVDLKPGRVAALSVLEYLMSPHALEYAYQRFQSSRSPGGGWSRGHGHQAHRPSTILGVDSGPLSRRAGRKLGDRYPGPPPIQATSR